MTASHEAWILSPAAVARGMFPLPTRRDFLAGTAAGISITLVGHPFDTVKVRLQTQDVMFDGKSAAKTSAPASAPASASATAAVENLKTPTAGGASKAAAAELEASLKPFKGGLDCVRRTIAREGPLALYRGMEGPLLTVPLLNAIVFAAYEQGKNFLRNWHDHDVELSHEPGGPLIRRQQRQEKLTMLEISLAGGWAGFVNSCIVGPVELVKSRLQVQYEARGTKSALSGPWAVMRAIVEKRGVRGLFLGMNTTIVREVPAYCAQFYGYEVLKRFMTPAPTPANPNPSLGNLATMFAGAMAGVNAWIWSYPQDIIKSRIQIQPDTFPPRYPPHRIFRFDGGFIACAKEIYAAKGLRGFWVGFGPTLSRALPANAVGFLTYEFALKFLSTRGFE